MPIIIISLIWLGALIGVTFIATPIKFRAKELTRTVALEVGRVTFDLFTKIEGCLALILLSLCMLQGINSLQSLLSSVMVAIVGVELFYLLPILEKRVQTILEDKKISPSRHHSYYVALEILKAILLLAIFFVSYENLCGLTSPKH